MRAKISGTKARPRLSVFVSNRHLHLQLINDELGKTVAQASTLEIKDAKQASKIEGSAKLLCERAKKAGINQAVFDRGGKAYHGKVKTVAEIARKEGLKI